MSIFISTGEISGDIYAAKLCKALSRILPRDEMWGMCGERAEGVRRLWSNDALHIFGLGRIVKSLPALFRLRDELARAVAGRNPAAVIVVDSPDFHIPLLGKIRALGYAGPVVYVCPPTIWAWREGRAEYLKKYCDLCLPLFRFEEKALEKHGVRSYWNGNPLIEDFSPYRPSANAPTYDERRVALLPGSRRSEINALLPLLEETALALREWGFNPVFSVAPGLTESLRRMIVQNRHGVDSTQISGRDLMYASRFVVGACGTAAVEAMLLDRFMIVLYRGTALEWRIYKALTLTKFVAVPNVLSGRMTFPELLQDDANVPNIVSRARRYLEDAAYREGVHSQIAADRKLLGDPGAVERWAAEIAKLVNR